MCASEFIYVYVLNEMMPKKRMQIAIENNALMFSTFDCDTSMKFLNDCEKNRPPL